MELLVAPDPGNSAGWSEACTTLIPSSAGHSLLSGALADLGRGLNSWQKQASAPPKVVQALTGRLYCSRSGWILLSVPNSLVRGAFDALDEPGVELPSKDTNDPSSPLDAHISVMRPEELERIGGPAAVTERGHPFRYTLGPVETVVPAGWDGVARVWMIRCESEDLEKLRVSYGLTPKPNNNRFSFHITVGILRKGVLGENRTSKTVPSTLDDKPERPGAGVRLLRERLRAPRTVKV